MICPNCGLPELVNPSCANHSCTFTVVSTTGGNAMASGAIFLESLHRKADGSYYCFHSQSRNDCLGCLTIRAEKAERALSQAQQALRRIMEQRSCDCLDRGYCVNCIAKAALPSDAPPSSELNLPCLACGKPKNDSTMHHDAPGKNWGAALHWFEAPPSDAPEAAK